MARSRNIKPGFFLNDKLVELNFATRLLFAGLWILADREGRLEDRPKKIKIGLFPADDVDVDAMLQSLHEAGFIARYEVAGVKFVQVVSWAKHQNPHHTEKASEIPGAGGRLTVRAPFEPRHTPSSHGGNLADSGSLIPDSRFPEKKPKARLGATTSREISLLEYLEQCQAEERRPIPPDHFIHEYGKDAGLTEEMLQVAWLVFKDRHLKNAKVKKQIDWPMAFANNVKGCWQNLWYVNQEGQAEWTKVGVQERRVLEAQLNKAQQMGDQHAHA